MTQPTYPLIADDYRYYALWNGDLYVDEHPVEHQPFANKTVPIVDEDAGVIAYTSEALAPFLSESLSAMVFINQVLEKQAMEDKDPAQALAEIAAIIDRVQKLNIIDIEVAPAS